MLQQMDNLQSNPKPTKVEDEKGMTMLPCNHINCNGNYGLLTGSMVDFVNEEEKQSPISITEDDALDQDSGVENNDNTSSGTPDATFSSELNGPLPEPSGHNELAAFRQALTKNRTSEFVENAGKQTMANSDTMDDTDCINEETNVKSVDTYQQTNDSELDLSSVDSSHDKHHDTSHESSHNTSETFDSEETYLLDDYSLSGKTPGDHSDTKTMFFYGQPIELSKGPDNRTHDHRGWHEPFITNFYQSDTKALAASQKKMFKRVRKLVK